MTTAKRRTRITVNHESKEQKEANKLSLMKDASFVRMVQFLIVDPNRLKNFIALFSGFSLAGIYPIASFTIFHHTIWLNIPIYQKIILGLIGFAGIAASINNVYKLICHMTKTVGIMPFCASLLLEGTAMAMGGDAVSSAVGLFALFAIIYVNTVKMTYNALIGK